MRAPRLLLAALSIIAVVATASAARVPDFTFTTDRGPLKLQDLRGKVVYLDYWASWCGPCRQTFPFMNELHARYRDKDFVVVAVTLDKNVADARRFLAQYPANFIIAYDPDGTTARALGVKGMPTSFIINQSGEIVATHVGFNEAYKSKIEREIKSLLPAGTTM
jgi:cytochrome c biogenesis protein CcmG, thiol:disulfide interchange protein DsbE